MKPNLTLKFFSVLLVAAFLFTAVMPVEAAAPYGGRIGVRAFPSFEKFVSTVTNGQTGVVRGVYVSDVLALRVVQQPAGNAGFVSRNSNVATQFGMAADQGVTGLLAHNYLAGQTFFNLAVGQEVRIVYGNGAVKTYIISAVYQYQALEPANVYSDLVDLSNGLRVTVGDVFGAVYAGDDHVTFQTCIKRDGNASWGRLFVVAYPA
ncbi:MAG TPA: hypothetical protein VI547_05035 [Anaerolineales bacterium]|nr:hypothetical protein [Anaerolineales bacterium]